MANFGVLALGLCILFGTNAFAETYTLKNGDVMSVHNNENDNTYLLLCNKRMRVPGFKPVFAKPGKTVSFPGGELVCEGTPEADVRPARPATAGSRRRAVPKPATPLAPAANEPAIAIQPDTSKLKNCQSQARTVVGYETDKGTCIVHDLTSNDSVLGECDLLINETPNQAADRRKLPRGLDYDPVPTVPRVITVDEHDASGTWIKVQKTCWIYKQGKCQWYKDEKYEDAKRRITGGEPNIPFPFSKRLKILNVRKCDGPLYQEDRADFNPVAQVNEKAQAPRSYPGIRDDSPGSGGQQ